MRVHFSIHLKPRTSLIHKVFIHLFYLDFEAVLLQIKSVHPRAQWSGQTDLTGVPAVSVWHWRQQHGPYLTDLSEYSFWV